MLFDIEIGGRTRKALAQPSKTGWVYILDRTNGRPLIGIEERPVPQEPRQATARTQPFPVGDAFVPQSMTMAPEGFQLVNQGRIFTPFWTDPIVAKPGQGGGANWPPSSFDPRSGYLYVCASDRTGVFKGGDSDFDLPMDGERYIGRVFGAVRAGAWASIPLGILLGGVVVGAIGPAPTFLVIGIAYLAVTLYGYLNPAFREMDER